MCSTEDERAEPARRVHARHETRVLLARRTNRARLHARGVGQRPQHVECRREAESAAHRGCEAHRRMHLVREKEGDANLVKDAA